MNDMTPELRKMLQAVLASSFEPKELLQFATVRLSFDDVKVADDVNFNQNKGRAIGAE